MKFKSMLEVVNHMKKANVLVIMVISLALAGPALAQSGAGMGMGGGMGPRLYDPQTVTTVTGQVEKLEESAMGREHGLSGGHPQDRSGQPHGAPGSRLVPGREKVCG